MKCFFRINRCHQFPGHTATMFSGLPIIVGEIQDGPETVTKVHETERCEQKVRCGFCTEVKTVQYGINSRNGVLEIVMVIYESANAPEPQAILSLGLQQNDVVRALRAIEILKALEVTDEKALMLAIGSVYKDADCMTPIAKSIGDARLQEIMEMAPDAVNDVIVALHDAGICFSHDDIRDALRNGCLEESDATNYCGIEPPNVYDARKTQEKEMTKHLLTHFRNWQQHASQQTSPIIDDDLCNFAAGAMNRGVESTAIIVGVAIFMSHVTHDDDIAHLSHEGLAEVIDVRHEFLVGLCQFLAKRFSGNSGTIHEAIREIAHWWNVTDPQYTTPVERHHPATV